MLVIVHADHDVMESILKLNLIYIKIIPEGDSDFVQDRGLEPEPVRRWPHLLVSHGVV